MADMYSLNLFIWLAISSLVVEMVAYVGSVRLGLFGECLLVLEGLHNVTRHFFRCTMMYDLYET